MTKKLLATVAFLCWGVGFAFAEPVVNSISGSLVDNARVVISGYNFGTKSPVEPLMWENCESHANHVNDHGYAASQLHDAWPYHSDCGDWRLMFKNNGSNRWPGAPHNRSQIILGGGHKDNYPSNQNCRNVGFTIDAGSPQSRWFLMWYARKSPDFPTSAPSGGWLYNHKAGPFQTGSTCYNGEICQMWGLNAASGQTSGWAAGYCEGYCDGTLRYGNSNIPSLRDDWVHLEIQFKNDAGLFKTIGNNLVSIDANCSQSEIPIFSTPPRSWSLGGYLRWYYPSGVNTGIYHCSDNAWRYMDDIYADNTLQRVILANDSYYEHATIIEPQVPKNTWNNTTIEIEANLGNFPESGTGYLFVFDADNNHNMVGHPVTIGGGSGDRPPTVNITSPTSASTYTTSQSTIDIGGNASDDVGISTITWRNNRGGSGAANNDSGDWTSWSITNISLEEDENVIIVTATDSAGQTSTNSITVTYSASGTVQAWSATQQTGDTSWGDSFVTYCARLLIEGNHVTGSGDVVRLGFQGRSSGTYSIRKVSIAKRDTSGAEGDVIDSTWTKVTFDGRSEATWVGDVVSVPPGGEKLSNAIPFSLEAGTDYYVTFKIDTPSVWLNPPSGYRELFFETADHTEDIDWSGNGHGSVQDYHALSKIYLVDSGGDITSPMVTLLLPTAGDTYTTDADTITIGGTASDNVGVTRVTWTNSRGGSGIASGTTDWTISNVNLQCGQDNIITVSAEDAAGNNGADTLTVNVKPCPVSGLLF